MSVHERAVGETTEWYTPASLFEALGATFDLDPAGAPAGKAPWVARRIRTKVADGLGMEWEGHVWLNPPYGPAAVEFIDRMIAHGDGLMLLPSRTETAAYQRALYAANAVCLLRERLWFHRADGFVGRSSFGSTLFAFGDWAVDILRAADLGWTTYQLWGSVESINDDPRLDHPKCGAWMPRAQEPCFRWPGHRTSHRTRFAVECGRKCHRRKYLARKARAARRAA